MYGEGKKKIKGKTILVLSKIKTEPKVGIFYFINSKILMDAVPVAEGEPYGRAIQHGSHYDFWESLVPKTLIERKFKSRAYDAYPRGRVVYFPKRKKYLIYYDACLEVDDEITIISEKFELTGVDIESGHDEHYKCAECNRDFMD